MFLGAAGAGLCAAAGPLPAAPAHRVALARCPRYGPGVLAALDRMFDQLGGLDRLVRHKTVSIKVNLGGPANARLGYRFHGRSNWVHPDVIGAAVFLLGRAGARRIRLLEGARYTGDPLEEHLLEAGYEPRDFLSAAPRVSFVNTNILGREKRYVRFPVPGGGLVFPAFDLHPAYAECDVFVSLAKLKEHGTTGITLALKNCFGITPTSIYGDDSGEAEPNENPRAGRGSVFHFGKRQPSGNAPAENDPALPRDSRFRVPRIVADIAAARRIDLAIIDGIESMAGGEGVAGNVEPVTAGVLVAGTNAVNTDAVAAAVMNYDPMADRGTAPFERCDNTLRLAEELGLGTRDLRQIEIAGARVAEARFDFAALSARRAAAAGPG